MRFQIRQGQNRYDGSDMFYVYQWEDKDNRWSYIGASSKEQDMRDLIERMKTPVEERVIAEIESPTT